MEVDNRLELIEERLEQYNKLLETHIKRTDMLEDYIKNKDEDWKLLADKMSANQESSQKFTIKILTGIGVFVGIVIPLIVSLLNAMK